MLRRSWETKKKIIKELNNRLNEKRIISEQEETNLEKLEAWANKYKDRYKYNFFRVLNDKDFVNSLSQNVLDAYYGLAKSSCGIGTSEEDFVESIKKIQSKKELLELDTALRKKPICGNYESLDDVLNGEFTGTGDYTKESKDYIIQIKDYFESKNIATINFTPKKDYIQPDTIEVVSLVEKEPETEETETEETETEEKKSFTDVSGVKTLEDIVSNKKIIKKGNSGDIVKLVQQSLLDLKYDIGGTEPDGKFGPKTKAAVQKFQKDNGLTDDGIVGPKTTQKMIDVISSNKKSSTEIVGGEELIKDVEKIANDEALTKKEKIEKLDEIPTMGQKEREDEIEKYKTKIEKNIPIDTISESEISKPILEMMRRMNILK